MDFYITISLLWVIIGNVWHGFLLMQRKGAGRPLTISEHAVENDRLLLTHRIVHSLPLLMFMPMIFGYLIPQGYIIAAALLVSSAVFDSLETLTLNKNTARWDNGLNLHSFTA